MLAVFSDSSESKLLLYEDIFISSHLHTLHVCSVVFLIRIRAEAIDLSLTSRVLQYKKPGKKRHQGNIKQTLPVLRAAVWLMSLTPSSLCTSRFGGDEVRGLLKRHPLMLYMLSLNIFSNWLPDSNRAMINIHHDKYSRVSSTSLLEVVLLCSLSCIYILNAVVYS